MTATVEVFQRSDEARMRSLAHANEVRFARARLKRSLRGFADAATVVRDTPDYARTMKVTVLLRAIPRVGPLRIRRILATVGMSDAKTLGGLTDRQRAALLAALEAQA